MLNIQNLFNSNEKENQQSINSIIEFKYYKSTIYL